MEFLRQTMSGAELSVFLDIPPALHNKRVEIIVLPAGEKVAEEPNYACNIGCCPELPELPDSFFDPLPEEDLQAWGL